MKSFVNVIVCYDAYHGDVCELVGLPADPGHAHQVRVVTSENDVLV